MTLITVLTIQNLDNDIRCETYGLHAQTKKWAGAINLYHNGIFHTTLLSSDPIYESADASVVHMEDVVQRIRDINVKEVMKNMP